MNENSSEKNIERLKLMKRDTFLVERGYVFWKNLIFHFNHVVGLFIQEISNIQ